MPGISVYIKYTTSSLCKVHLPFTQPSWHTGDFVGNFQLIDLSPSNYPHFLSAFYPHFFSPLYLISSTHLPITWLSLYKVLLFPSCFFLSPHPATPEFHELDVKDIITFCPTPEALRNYQFHRAPTEAWGLLWSWQYNWNTFCILRTLSPHIRSSLFSPVQPENLSGGESDHNLIGSHSLAPLSPSLCKLWPWSTSHIIHLFAPCGSSHSGLLSDLWTRWAPSAVLFVSKALWSPSSLSWHLFFRSLPKFSSLAKSLIWDQSWNHCDTHSQHHISF